MTEQWDDYPDWAWDRDSKAVLACDGDHVGVVLWTVGPHVRFEMKEGGFVYLEDLGLDDALHGLSVWEGKMVDVFGEAEPVGKFRKLTDVEWHCVRLGECPWDDNDWRQQEVRKEKELDDESCKDCGARGCKVH